SAAARPRRRAGRRARTRWQPPSLNPIARENDMTRTEIEAKHIDWRTIIKAADDTPADVVAALDAYFAPFAQPVFDENRESEKPMLCLKCGEPLTGLLASMFGRGGFEWGIAHGEGHCAGCRWPARGHHY